MIKISRLFIDHVPVKADIRSHVAVRPDPILSWSVISDKTEAKQQEFRIRIGQFDSGWVMTDDQQYALQGESLNGNDAINIELLVRDNYGEESEKFCTQIYNGVREWDIPWIGTGAESPKPLYFKKTFRLPENIQQARVFYCGLGYATLFFNNERIGDAYLDPSFTDYSKRIEYVYIPDITSKVKAGHNTITAIVTAGWRENRIDLPQGRVCNFFGPLQLSLSLECVCNDGIVIRVVTDNSWEVGNGPITEAGIFSGEVYDANIHVLDEKYKTIELSPPTGRMIPSDLPPIKRMVCHTPVCFWSDEEDSVILDFGKNIAGVLSVPLTKGRKGNRITITHSEELTEDGHLFRDTLRQAKACDEYVFSGDEDDLLCWTPSNTYHGFRYAKIKGASLILNIQEVQAIELRNDVDKKTVFRCGNPLINTIHEICVATERANQHSIFTDCPQRDERMGWMNDATVRFEFTPYITDTSAFFPKIIKDVMDVQIPSGAIGCTAPLIWGNVPADPVCSAYLVAGMQAYLHNGDMKTIKEAYPSWAAWEEYLLSRSKNYIVDYSYYGDWAGPVDCCIPEPSGVPGAKSAVTPGIFMSTCYLLYNAKLLSQFAKLLDYKEDVVKYDTLAAKIREAFIAKWYNGNGIFATGSQGCQTMALYLGLSPHPELTAKRLHDRIIADDWRLTTGNLCSKYIFDVLSENGYLEDAWRLMNRTEYPSIGYMISQEATTVWERFELMKSSAMNSHNHPMYAAVGYWMFAYLVGVKPIEAGWKTCSINPYIPNGLNSAQAAVETPLGMISVRWTKRYGTVNLQVQIPFGMKAHIKFFDINDTIGSGFYTYASQLQ